MAAATVVLLMCISNAQTTSLDKKPLQELEREIPKLKGEQKALHQLAASKQQMGNESRKAITNARCALKIAREEKNELLEAKSLSTLGLCYYYIGDYEKSYGMLLQGLLLSQRINFHFGIAANHLNMAQLLLVENDYEGAREHMDKARKIALTYNLKDVNLNIDNSLGYSYFLQGKYQDALRHFTASDSLNRLNKRWQHVANDLNNIGGVYQKLKDYPKALYYYKTALEMYDSLKLLTSKATIYCNMAEAYYDMNNNAEAERYLEQGLALSDSIHYIQMLMIAYELKAKLKARQGHFAEAFDAQNKYVQYKDSLFNEQKKLAIYNMETRLQVSEKERRLNEQEQERNLLAILLYSSVTVVVMLALVMAFALSRSRYRRLTSAKLTRLNDSLNRVLDQLREENARNKAELEQAHDLQQAILPKTMPDVPGLEVMAYLETAASVGGDFYDYHLDEDGSLTLAVGDATGHGLRAAFLVTVAKSHFQQNAGSEELETIVRAISSGITALSLHEMFLALSIARISQGMLELYSGAMPPAFLLRADGEVIWLEAKGTFLGAPLPLQMHPIKIKMGPGDLLMMMSDGYPDVMNQDEETMGYERIPEMLLQVRHQPVKTIVDYMVQQAHYWRGKARLEDDLTLMVVKVPEIS